MDTVIYMYIYTIIHMYRDLARQCCPAGVRAVGPGSPGRTFGGARRWNAGAMWICGSVDPMWIGESMDIGWNIWNGSVWNGSEFQTKSRRCASWVSIVELTDTELTEAWPSQPIPDGSSWIWVDLWRMQHNVPSSCTPTRLWCNDMLWGSRRSQPRAIWVWLAQRCLCFWFQYVLTKKTALLILLIFVHFILIWLLNLLNGRFSLHIWVLPVLPVLPVTDGACSSKLRMNSLPEALGTWPTWPMPWYHQLSTAPYVPKESIRDICRW